MTESILNILKDEHHKVETLMERIQKSQDVVRKKELYLMLKEDLIPHMEGEEQTIYAHLIEDVHEEEAQEVAQHASDEHDEIKRLLSKLDNIGIESDEWDSTFRYMKTCLTKHIQEEESELFAEAKEDFSRQELSEFADEFAEVKQHINPG